MMRFARIEGQADTHGMSSPLSRRLAAFAVALTILAAPASAAASVRSARGATRSALRSAFIRQDGTRVGISGEYVLASDGVVCQRTPDAGLVRFLFSRSGRSWRFRFLTRGTRRGNSTQRALERACR
jgi:hypothetical protein